MCALLSFGMGVMSTAFVLLRAAVLPLLSVGVLLTSCLFTVATFAQTTQPVRIQVNQSEDQPIRIAVVPFKQSGNQRINVDIASMIRKHFALSGLLVPVPVDDMLNLPHTVAGIHYPDWTKIHTEYLLIGEINQQKGKRSVRVDLVDALQKKKVFSYRTTVTKRNATDVANHIADKTFKYITGIDGIFRSYFSFVEEEEKRTASGGKKKSYSLKVVNINGENERTIFRSKNPIWSPAWSTDGQLAYVTFLRGVPAVVVHNFAKKTRYYVTLPNSMTSAPDWGKKNAQLLITLNRNGNADLAVFDVKKRTTKRLTRNGRIDTEGSWSPNMNRIIFTSDRYGLPQIMEYDAKSKQVRRVTKDKVYNANPRYLDEDNIIFVRRDDKGRFNLFTLHLDTGFMNQVTQEKGDVESVSVSPNGHYAIYTVTNGKKSKLKILHVKSKQNFAFFESRPNQFLRSGAWSRAQ